MIECLCALCEAKKLQCVNTKSKYDFENCGTQLECLGKNKALITKLFNNCRVEKELCISDFEKVVRENPRSDVFIVRTPILHTYEAYIVPQSGSKRLVKLPPDTFSYASLNLRDRLLRMNCAVMTDRVEFAEG